MRSVEEKLVSIIVPVYNSEKYLDECILSLINQTYKNLQVILVDDGSSDNSLHICEEWVQKDNRINVYSKSNGGAASARNYGISKADGDYFSFIYSDDVVSEYFIEKLYMAIVESNADISICALDYVNEDNSKIIKKSIHFSTGTTHNKIQSIIGFENVGVGTYWDIVANKLFKKELFDKISFREGMVCEDIDIMLKLYCASEKIVHVEDELYHYRMQAGSVTHNKQNEIIKAQIINMQDRENIYNSLQIKELYIKQQIHYYSMLHYYDLYTMSEGKRIQKKIRKAYKLMKYSEYISRTKKIKIVIACLNIRLYDLLARYL